jgi:AraC family transcriptional regulator
MHVLKKSLLCSIPGNDTLPSLVFEKTLQMKDEFGASYVCSNPIYIPEHSDPHVKIAIYFKNTLLQAKWWTAAGQKIQHYIREGHVSIIPANLLHESCIEKPLEMIVISLNPALILQAAEELGINTIEIIENWAAKDPLIQQLGFALRREFQQGSPGNLYVESVANILTVHLLKHYSAIKVNHSDNEHTLPPSRMQQVTEYINTHLEQDLKLAELARLVQMSPYRFARAFKQSIGLPPHQYLLSCRVERAKTLLSETQFSILEIGNQLGFSSQSHFTSVFRRFTATTPNAYREAL